MPIAGGSCCRTVRCCIFRCPYIALYFLATGFTVLLFLAYLWDNHENHKNEELYNFLSRKSNFENLACNGQGVGIKPIAPVNTSVVRRSRTGEKPKCEFIKQPLQTLELNSPEIIVDNENDIFHTIMHPKKISSNLLHNFAPVMPQEFSQYRVRIPMVGHSWDRRQNSSKPVQAWYSFTTFKGRY